MDKEKVVKVAVVVGALGLVAYVVKGRLTAASTANTAQTNSVADLSGLSYAPVGTGVSTSGMFAGGTSVDSSSASSDAAVPTQASGVASFASLLQGILGSAQTANVQAQTNVAANNAAVTQAVQAVAPTPVAAPAPVAAPVSAPAPVAAPAYTGDTSLVQRAGGYLVANTGLYASDATYRWAWDNVAGANQSRFGTQWNSQAAGASYDQLNQEVSTYIKSTQH